MVGQALGLLHYLLSWRQASDPLGWEQGEGSGCQQGEETRMCFTQAKLDWQGTTEMAVLPGEALKFPRLAPLVSDALKSY